MTDYVVLRVVEAESSMGTLVLVAQEDGSPETFSAPNDVAALKAAEAKTGMKFDDGAYAVPVRSWRLRKPEEKLEPRRLWS